MIKKFIIHMSFIILLGFICFIPFGCDEETGTGDGAKVTSKSGYIYAPAQPATDKNGLSIGLVAMEQASPPEGYTPVSNARVSIGNTRVKTDGKGSFKITNLQPGEHQMVICASGFQPYVQMTAVSAAETTTIAIDTIKIIPEKPVMMNGDALQFIAVGREAAGNYVPLSGVKWSIFNDKKISEITNTGFLTAKDMGSAKIVASSGKNSATTEVNILNPAGADTSTVSGQVNLPSGSPVANAQVIVGGTNLTGLTDEEGVYSVLSVPSEIELKVFVVKNDLLIGTGSLKMEKWKEKNFNIIATDDPPEFDDSDMASTTESAITTSPSAINGYVLVPTDEKKDTEGMKEKPGLVVIQDRTVPSGYKAVAGADVMFEDDPTISSTTSSDGGFTLDGIPSKKEGAPYFVVVSLEGYLSVRCPVTFTGEYPLGTVDKIDIWPEKPLIIKGETIEFKAIVYDRKRQIIKTPELEWAFHSNIGEINTINGIFTSKGTGKATVNVTYADVTGTREFNVIDGTDTGKMSGVITDELGRPVKGAFIILNNSPWVGITDSNGKYDIPFVPAGIKIPVAVKANGKFCGESLVSLSKDDEVTRDISITLPKDANKATEPEIPDNPPSSTNPGKNTEGNGKSQGGKTEKITGTNEENDKNRDEFPRWPDTKNLEQNKNVDDSKNNFPRWPVPDSDTTKSNKTTK